MKFSPKLVRFLIKEALYLDCWTKALALANCKSAQIHCTCSLHVFCTIWSSTMSDAFVLKHWTSACCRSTTDRSFASQHTFDCCRLVNTSVDQTPKKTDGIDDKYKACAHRWSSCFILVVGRSVTSAEKPCPINPSIQLYIPHFWT